MQGMWGWPKRVSSAENRSPVRQWIDKHLKMARTVGGKGGPLYPVSVILHQWILFYLCILFYTFMFLFTWGGIRKEAGNRSLLCHVGESGRNVAGSGCYAE